MPLAPVINALVVTERAWERLSSDDQEAFLSIGQEFEDNQWDEVPRQDREAIDQMRGRRLTVSMPDDAAIVAFRQTADELTSSMRGTMVPQDIYDLALRERNSFRGQ